MTKTFKEIQNSLIGSPIDEISIAQKQQRRRNRMNKHLQKTMAKYRAAAKAGIHPSKVHQRRNTLTVKKG